jgi:hypothetical protein
VLEVSFRSRPSDAKVIATVMIAGGAKDGERVRDSLVGKHQWEIQVQESQQQQQSESKRERDRDR